jgi:hypothetical protein
MVGRRRSCSSRSGTGVAGIFDKSSAGGSAGFARGRSYSGAPSVSGGMGMSATVSPFQLATSRPVAVTSPMTAASRSHFWKMRSTSASRPFAATSSMRSCDSESRIS